MKTGVGRSQPSRRILFLLALLGATFFAFVDDRFRGWDDTNQYQIEARAWGHGLRPPVAEMLVDPHSHVGPTHTPPLVPYSWSLFISGDEFHQSLRQIKLFQAALLFFCFLGFALVSIKRNHCGGVVATCLCILLFFNEFSRELVSIPLSEPLALFLLIASYLWPPIAGIGVALEFMVRPPLILLFAPLLWRQKKSPVVVIGALLTLALGFIKFGRLILPSTFKGGGLNFDNVIRIFKIFSTDAALQWFEHLLPYQINWLMTLWQIALAIGMTTLLIRGRKHPVAIVAALGYFVLILIPWAQGVRYFVPLILFLLVEVKPPETKSLLIKALVVVLCLHLVDRQIESAFEFHRYPTPDTESVGMVSAKNWLAENHFDKDYLLMAKFRYCLNFFETRCYGSEVNFGDVINDLRQKQIHFIVITGLTWQAEERNFLDRFKKALAEKRISLDESTHHFNEVSLIDVREL